MKSDVLNKNTIIETKKSKVFKNVFPLKVEHIPKRIENPAPSSKEISNEVLGESLRKSKRQKKETSFGYNFFTYLVEGELKDFYDAIFSPDVEYRKKLLNYILTL